MKHHTSPQVLANEGIFDKATVRAHFADVPFTTPELVSVSYIDVAKEMALLRHDLEVWAKCARAWRRVAIAAVAAFVVVNLVVWFWLK